MTDDTAGSRERILTIAADMLEREGADSLSTRAVAAAAGIRAAALYQLFGDKQGLLSALAVHAFDHYLAEKGSLPTSDDPVADIRRGWDAHVSFGLRHPSAYVLMFGTDRPGRRPPAYDEALAQVSTYLHLVARTGRLRVPPAAAADLLQAGVTGVTLALIAESEERRDLQVSERMRDVIVGAVVADVAPLTDPGLAPTALALDAKLASDGAPSHSLEPPETALLRVWLRRLAEEPHES